LRLNVKALDAQGKIMKRSKKKLTNRKGANIVTGIAWYSSEQWAELRRVVSDPEEVEAT